MGYSVAGHLLDSEPDVANLGNLPPELGARVWRVTAERAGEHRPYWGIESFPSGDAPEWPFTLRTNRFALDAEVVAAAPAFARAVHALHAGELAAAAALHRPDLSRRELADRRSSLRIQAEPGLHGELSDGLRLSATLGARVLSFTADDEEPALVAVCDRGAVERIGVSRGSFGLEYAEGVVHAYRTRGEEDDPDPADDEHVERSLRALSAAGAVIEPTRTVEPLLHRLVVEAMRELTGSDEPLLGVGDWDRPDRYAGELVLAIRAERERRSVLRSAWTRLWKRS